jgi:hypothetical protein
MVTMMLLGKSLGRLPVAGVSLLVTLLIASALYVLGSGEKEARTAPSAAAALLPPSSQRYTPPTEMTIDYSDPVGRGQVPLMLVEGRRHEQLAPNVRIGELASRDGAPYARISPEIVAAIEAMRNETDAVIVVLSGYRHVLRNALSDIGGARESQHVAGRAADLASPDLTPLELAELALDVLGCEIGLGLGTTAIHIDMRGSRSVWAYESDESAEDDFVGDEFERWVADYCGDEPEDGANAEVGAMSHDGLDVRPVDSLDVMLDQGS